MRWTSYKYRMCILSNELYCEYPFQSSVADPECFIPDPALNFPSSGSNPYYFRIFENYKKNLKFTKKKNLPTTVSAIFYFILQTYNTWNTQSRIHRPKKRNIFFYLSALSFFAGSGTIIPDPGKSSGGSATLLSKHHLIPRTVENINVKCIHTYYSTVFILNLIGTLTHTVLHIYIPTSYKWIRKFCYSVTYSTHHPLEQQHYRLNNTFFTTTIRQLSAHCPSYPPPPIRHSLPPLLSTGLPYSSCTVQCTDLCIETPSVEIFFCL